MSNRKAYLGVGSLLSLTLISGAVLSAPKANADTSAIVNLTVNVPAACSLTPANTYLTNTINPGTNKEIGTANLKAVCNDPSGFAIYAVGYTNEEYGNTNLITDLGSNHSIHTGTGTSTSNWNMTIANDDDVTGDHVATIENGFNQARSIPETYTKIASFDSTTDQSTGANLLTRFDAYIAPNQAAGTYEGKVKFTLVHPSNEQNPAGYLYYDANGGENAPERQAGEEGSETGTYNYTISSQIPHKYESVFLGWSEDPEATEPEYQPEEAITSNKPLTLYAVWRQAQIAMLEMGKSINAKFKNLANNTTNASDSTQDTEIQNLRRANTLPDDFVVSATNTISIPRSTPVYIFFNDGVMYYYTTADIIYLNSDSSYMFNNLRSINGTFSLSDLDASKVTIMNRMFEYTGYSSTNFSLDLSGWDVSSVVYMYGMFSNAGYSSTNFSLDLSGWDTQNVVDMNYMFSDAGHDASSYNLNISDLNTSKVTGMHGMFYRSGYNANSINFDFSHWDTSDVTDMAAMFSQIGYNATTFSINVSGWDTSKVTNMGSMFYYAGYSATTFSPDLSGWDTSSVTNMSNMFYCAGYSATTWSLGNLSNWDTSSVTNMHQMFYYAGTNATTFSLNLSNWNSFNVTDMIEMFVRTGYNATTYHLNLSHWNTSSVTSSMSQMFSNAGRNATIWSVTIPQTNGNGITNTTSQMFGNTNSIYAPPASGRSFTLAQ
ncbi:BspA family leucine-rich repeat surface protein [Candidatus Saccharibacteria bacterium]|nr:BspA family leucine-rich repeat surface protein [Candidatus Saccharibacteria bacterium]